MSRRGENIYKRRDGRWEGRYIKERKEGGVIRYGYIYGKKYREVKQSLLKKKLEFSYEQKQNTGNYAGTFREWTCEWLNGSVVPSTKPSTYASYENKLRLHLLPALGDKKLVYISKNDIQILFSVLEKKLKPSSVHAIFRVLRTCFRHAVLENKITNNPTDNIRLPKAMTSKARALDQQEQRVLSDVAKEDTEGLPILMALETGMRIGEISGLKWSDIDFSKKKIHVNRTLQRLPMGNGYTKIIELCPKTIMSRRVIPLSKKLKALLLSKRKEKQGDYVFGKKNKWTEPRLLSYHFQRLAKKAKIKGVSFHSLRHSFATRCLEFGITIASISSLLGHSSVKMTLDIYTHSSLKEEIRAIEKLSSF
ncbi:hypothetical protein A5881_002312 [Enterococcus termitis]|nr:hypothetical protein A5881_001370 [Enterococcus termitis]